jgi:hypothetical protein
LEVELLSMATYCLECGRYLQSDLSGLAGGVSTYAYALNSPLRNIDPMGLWVCAVGNCESFKAGLQSLKSAVNSGNLDPYQQATLANIVNAYGDEGTQNVQIKYGTLPSGVYGRTSGGTKAICASITFDDRQLNNLGKIGDYWGQTVTHEGQHVSDDSEWYSESRISTYDSEVNAYAAQGYFNQSNQYNSGKSGLGSLWSLSGGINWSVINSRAGWSSKQDSVR